MRELTTTESTPVTNRKSLALLLWILVAFFYFYLSYDYIRATMTDTEFDEYLQHVVNVAVTEQRPAKEVRALVLVKAEELSLPIRADQIMVTGGGDNLNLALDYRVDIEIPLLQRTVYSKLFQHRIKYKREY